MKKNIFTLVVATLMGGLVFSGCQTQSRKIDDTIENGLEATQSLKTGVKEVSVELKNALFVQDWLKFKKVSDFKIMNNDIRIAQLKINTQRRATKPAPGYLNKLNELENVNLGMKKKLLVYSTDQNELNSYKNEFNHDLEMLEQTLTDLTFDNQRN